MCHGQYKTGKTIRYKATEADRKKIPYNRSKNKQDFRNYEE
jgi:hypothetical protein